MAEMVAMEAMAEDHRVRFSLEGREVLVPEVVSPRDPVGVQGVGEVWVVLAVAPCKPEVTGEWWMDLEFGKTGSNFPPVSMRRTVPTIHTASTAPAPRSPLLAAQCRE